MRNGRLAAYVDPTHGFVIRPPQFALGSEGVGFAPVTFCGPPNDGFSSNVSVVVQNIRLAPSEYWALTLAQFSEAGFQLLAVAEKSVSGRQALLFEYEGTPEDRRIRFLALAVFDLDRVFLVTCAASCDTFPEHEPAFRECLEAFRVRESYDGNRTSEARVMNQPIVTGDTVDMALQAPIADWTRARGADSPDRVEFSCRVIPLQPADHLSEAADRTSDQVAATQGPVQQAEAELANKRAELAARHAEELARVEKMRRDFEAKHEASMAEFQSRLGRELNDDES